MAQHIHANIVATNMYPLIRVMLLVGAVYDVVNIKKINWGGY